MIMSHHPAAAFNRKKCTVINESAMQELFYTCLIPPHNIFGISICYLCILEGSKIAQRVKHETTWDHSMVPVIVWPTYLTLAKVIIRRNIKFYNPDFLVPYF